QTTLELMDNGGSIVNAVSVAGMNALAGSGGRTFSEKHAAVGLIRVAATDWGSGEYRGVAVAPGHIDTPVSRTVNNGQEEKIAKGIAASRIARKAEPEAIGGVAVFLLRNVALYEPG
ncbi:hypothetical protein DOTSEDRAFT_130507, partial [Dothistroma septosporum NZE10]